MNFFQNNLSNPHHHSMSNLHHILRTTKNWRDYHSNKSQPTNIYIYIYIHGFSSKWPKLSPAHYPSNNTQLYLLAYNARGWQTNNESQLMWLNETARALPKKTGSNSRHHCFNNRVTRAMDGSIITDLLAAKRNFINDKMENDSSCSNKNYDS